MVFSTSDVSLSPRPTATLASVAVLVSIQVGCTCTPRGIATKAAIELETNREIC